MANNNNEFGADAESLVQLLLNRYFERRLFRVVRLGDKWPLIDFYVEITSNKGMYFFVQVKASTRGYTTKKPKRLKVSVKKKYMRGLSKINAPSYIIGVDYIKKDYFQSTAYIASANDHSCKAVNSIPVRNKLTQNNLLKLKDEVVLYWKGTDVIKSKSIFLKSFVI